jgi:hypothetical protein
MESVSPAEELLLVHLIQTLARGRLWNAGNVWASWSSAGPASSNEEAT